MHISNAKQFGKRFRWQSEVGILSNSLLDLRIRRTIDLLEVREATLSFGLFESLAGDHQTSLSIVQPRGDDPVHVVSPRIDNGDEPPFDLTGRDDALLVPGPRVDILPTVPAKMRTAKVKSKPCVVRLAEFFLSSHSNSIDLIRDQCPIGQSQPERADR
jgi:hypothetical protein